MYFVKVKSVRRVPVSRSTTIASKATEMMDIEFLRQEINIDDHKIPIHDLLNRFGTFFIFPKTVNELFD